MSGAAIWLWSLSLIGATVGSAAVSICRRPVGTGMCRGPRGRGGWLDAQSERTVIHNVKPVVAGKARLHPLRAPTWRYAPGFRTHRYSISRVLT